MNVSTLSNTTTREERTLRMLAHANACASASASGSVAATASGTGDAYSMLVNQLQAQAGDIAAMCSGGMAVRAHVTEGSRSVVIMRTDSTPVAAAGEAARQRQQQQMRSATSPIVSDP
jgi:hypothetical protein